MIKGQYLNSLHPPNVFKYLVATVKQRRGRQHNNCDWLERNEELVLKYIVGYRNHDIFKVQRATRTGLLADEKILKLC